MYSPIFTEAYNNSKSKLPIHVWSEVIGKRLPYFKQNPSNIYSTVPLAIKIKGGINDSSGSIRVHVAPMDDDWYPKLQSALKTIFNKPVNVVDYLGRPIKDLTPEKLAAVGELDVVSVSTHAGANPLRLSSDTLVPPPEHMSTTKLSTIQGWINSVQDSVISAIADTLTGKTMAEISAATVKDGEVQKKIESALKSSRADWGEFLNTTYVKDWWPIRTKFAPIMHPRRTHLMSQTLCGPSTRQPLHPM
jgi:hypothetical protein